MNLLPSVLNVESLQRAQIEKDVTNDGKDDTTQSCEAFAKQLCVVPIRELGNAGKSKEGGRKVFAAGWRGICRILLCIWVVDRRHRDRGPHLSRLPTQSIGRDDRRDKGGNAPPIR